MHDAADNFLTFIKVYNFASSSPYKLLIKEIRFYLKEKKNIIIIRQKRIERKNKQFNLFFYKVVNVCVKKKFMLTHFTHSYDDERRLNDSCVVCVCVKEVHLRL